MRTITMVALAMALGFCSAAQAEAGFAWEEAGEKSLKLVEDGSPVFVYNHGTISGEKAPGRYDRANYLHPVYAPGGAMLTEDFPEDHYHHRGVFWAWPHVRVGGEEYETWVPSSGVTYRHLRWMKKEVGAERAELVAMNGWFTDGQKIMDERLKITAHAAADGRRAIDFEFTWSPADRAVTLQGRAEPKKSYGGFTFRFNTRVREDDGIPPSKVRVTTPRGVSDGDMVNERLKWADLAAAFPGAEGQSGAAVFISDTHPDYPPTWLTRHYGALCVGWPGVEPRTLEPGESVTCRYRVLTHDGTMSPAELRQAYREYLERE